VSSRLDRLIEGARTARVQDDGRAYVAELARWAPSRPRAPRWPLWLGAGALAAAAIALVWLWPPSTPASAPRFAAPAAALRPLQVGARVAIVAAPGTAYRIDRAAADATRIVVEQGAVTARLWPADEPHRLTLSGAGVDATATGTIYTLAVGPGGAEVRVHEGRVVVRDADGAHEVVPADPGTGASDVGSATVDALRAWVQRPVAPAEVAPTTALVDAGAPAVAAGGSVAAGDSAPASEPRPGARPTLVERWRRARLLRGQGRFADALALCLDIARERDPTWSPIAQLEAARIALDGLVDPARAEELARQLETDWPRHALVMEARAVACRAATQLGRDADCVRPTSP
jgi:hypothetical protein